MIGVDLALGLVALGALVLPGWITARAAKVSHPLLAGFIGGVVALVAFVLILDALGLRLDRLHCGVAWLALTFVALAFGRRAIPSVPGPPFAWREHAPLLLALVPALTVVVYRAVAQPLFGIDTIFRWNYLAEQMLARGTLGFYPPSSAADYAIYAWPDGIAPAVSASYFWTYALAGANRPVLSAPFIIGQFLLILVGTYALTRRMFSDRAAVFAVALTACSPVVLWATAMGQETGLMTLGLLGLLLYLPTDKISETNGAIVFAGLAAGLAALAREYGLVIPVLGVALALTRRLSSRAVLTFALAAALAVLPWYARNWVRTGNPIFSLDFFGLFPVNRAHAWLNESYQAEFAWARLPTGALRFVIVNCLVALVAGAAGAWLYFRPARPLLLAAAIIAVLWAASISYTAAGFTTALRVLAPALALGAVLGGAACAHWIPARRHLTGASLGLVVLAADSALRALTLPGTVYKIPPGEWLTAGHAVHDYHARPLYAELARAAGSSRILVLGPNALLTTRGASTLPLWSPEVSFLFNDSLSPATIARQLREANIGFVLLNKGSANERYLAHSAFFRDPGSALRAIWSGDDMIFLKVMELP